MLRDMRLPSVSPSNRSRVPPPLPARPKPPPLPPCDCLPLSEVDEWLNVLDEAVTASKESARENPKTLDIRLFTGTWNTGGKVLENSSILVCEYFKMFKHYCMCYVPEGSFFCFFNC